MTFAIRTARASDALGIAGVAVAYGQGQSLHDVEVADQVERDTLPARRGQRRGVARVLRARLEMKNRVQIEVPEHDERDNDQGHDHKNHGLAVVRSFGGAVCLLSVHGSWR